MFPKSCGVCGNPLEAECFDASVAGIHQSEIHCPACFHNFADLKVPHKRYLLVDDTWILQPDFHSLRTLVVSFLVL